MRECVDCSRPLNDGAIDCDWCAMRAEIHRLNGDLADLRDVAGLLLHGAGPDRSARPETFGGPWPAAVHRPEHLRRRAADSPAAAGQHTFWFNVGELERAADVLDFHFPTPDET